MNKADFHVDLHINTDSILCPHHQLPPTPVCVACFGCHGIASTCSSNLIQLVHKMVMFTFQSIKPPEDLLKTRIMDCSDAPTTEPLGPRHKRETITSWSLLTTLTYAVCLLLLCPGPSDTVVRKTSLTLPRLCLLLLSNANYHNQASCLLQ